MKKSDILLIERAVEMKEHLEKAHGCKDIDVAVLVNAVATLTGWETLFEKGLNTY